MTVYSDFSTEEQTLLLSSLQAAAVAISAASLGRKEETASEGFAAASFILEGKRAYVGNPLISSVIQVLEDRIRAEQAFPDYVAVATAPGASESALQTLRAAVELLDRQAAADEAAGYKAWLDRIAGVVATAGKEDQGLLGMGGVQVNDAERHALAAVAAALGLHPA